MSKDQIVAAICEQATHMLPAELTAESAHDFLQHIRTLAREEDHARLVAQIYAEAAVSPALAALVQRQLEDLRQAVAALLPHRKSADAERVAEVFVALCHAYTQQLAVRGDPDPAPYTAALMAIIECDEGAAGHRGFRKTPACPTPASRCGVAATGAQRIQGSMASQMPLHTSLT
ncbi:AcrR family transcriptional regulator [Amycolatopsis bartoniae]|uniref:Tetracyclin repressor-like C-terminal group 31 domain-containing protein n=1 Tax=Amycolatopsis bartoniae TaxID=941986 RepID=A0A8H9MGS8_9PSEU|nr:hypothetical protein [Amycolatopsis bartoniae]MBB2939370.1 AcrR family transcriptional regulator [Amycolatopsis bartoniae]TVT06707.1 hypothetical protein FNH07_19055 [Amycolatopsis bartoniae]GHF83522.1 hypothetical protein GCM10017566_66980 [Amycolatopsis bartoniae]